MNQAKIDDGIVKLYKITVRKNVISTKENNNKCQSVGKVLTSSRGQPIFFHHLYLF